MDFILKSKCPICGRENDTTNVCFNANPNGTHINVSENQKKYRYKKTGEIYNGQIYINGECCTDGHGNEVVYGF